MSNDGTTPMLSEECRAEIRERLVKGVGQQFDVLVTELKRNSDQARETFRDGIRARLKARDAALADIADLIKD